MPNIVAMAGLPATGKSTLAQALAKELGGVVLDKDVIRAALFPVPFIEYSSTQDDFCMSVLFQTARYLVTAKKTSRIFVDGRPFARKPQIDQLVAEVESFGYSLKIIFCTCSDATAKARLAEQQKHVAGNRNYLLYQKLQKEFEPIVLPHLVVDTDRPLAQVLAAAVAYLRAPISSTNPIS
jgi:predicted kinase